MEQSNHLAVGKKPAAFLFERVLLRAKWLQTLQTLQCRVCKVYWVLFTLKTGSNGSKRYQPPPMNSLLAPDDIHKRLDLISAQLNVIQARLELKPKRSSSPWVPLAEAAAALHFPSSRALRAAIGRGRIPPQFVSSTTGETGRRRTIYVDVEGFASHLRNK
jgi:hypothetical protein